MKRTLLALLLLAGCGPSLELGAAERLDAPVRLVSADAACARLAAGRATPGPVFLDVASYSIPLETADTLGPIVRARGADGRNAFLMVPLGPRALEHLEQLVVEKRLPGGKSAALQGRSGEWLTLRQTAEDMHLSGVAWTSSKSLTVTVEPAHLGLSLRAAVAFGGEERGYLLAVRGFRRAQPDEVTVTCRAFGDQTMVPIALPQTFEHRIDEAVLLDEHEALGLVAPSPWRKDRVDLLVLAAGGGG